MSLWERWKKVSINNKLMIYMTAILAVATTLYTLMYRSQVQFMKQNAEQTAAQTDRLIAASDRLANVTQGVLEEAKRVNKETGDRAERTAKAIEIQAQASMSQADASSTTARAAEASARIASQSQRPQIEAVEIGISPLPPLADQPVEFYAALENQGGTAAKGVEGKIYMQLRPNALPEILDYTPLTTNGSRSPLGVRDRKRLVQASDFRLTQDDINSINSRKSLLYVYGIVTYQDEINRRFHTLKFCGIYNPQTTRMDYCTRHNSSD